MHFRNVVGQVPNYKEVFIDEGDIDMHRCLEQYRDAGYEGVFIPDHTPSMHVGGWHAGMAYALGYIKAAARGVGLDVDEGPRNPHLDPALATGAAGDGRVPLDWAGHGSGVAKVGAQAPSRPRI